MRPQQAGMAVGFSFGGRFAGLEMPAPQGTDI
jgi:hypothetical protein